MNILNLTLTPFANETRILKESRSFHRFGLFQNIYVAAVYKDSIKELNNDVSYLVVTRFKLYCRKIPFKSVAFIGMYIEYFFKTWSTHRKKSINCVSAHSFGTLPIAVILATLWNAKCVYDAHELETEQEGLQGARQRLARWLERAFIRKSDLVMVVSESIADWYETSYDIERPTVILNAPNFVARLESNLLREKLKIAESSRIVIYQGFLTSGRGIELALDAFDDSALDKRLVLVFMGYGPLEERIIEAQKHNNKVFYLPAVPPDEVIMHTSSADIGLALIENTCLSYYLCMPNKLFEYAMVGVPVLASNMKEMAAFTKKNALGSVLQDYTTSCLVQELNHLASSSYSPSNTQVSATLKNLSWEGQEKKLLAAYNALLLANDS